MKITNALLEKWLEEEKFDEIIKTLEPLTVRKPTATAHRLYYLAVAYCMVGDSTVWSDRDYFLKAQDLLKRCYDDFCDIPPWYTLMAQCLAMSEQFGRAMPYVQKALEMDPTDEKTVQLHSVLKRACSVPLPKFNFIDRVQLAWEAFLSIEKDLRHDIDSLLQLDNSKKISSLKSDIEEKITKALSAALGEEVIVFATKSEDEYFLDIHPLYPYQSLLIDMFLDYVPKGLSDQWVFAVGQPYAGLFTFQFDKENSILVKDINAWLEPSAEPGMYDLCVYHPKFKKYAQQDTQTLKAKLQLICCQFAGEWIFDEVLADVKICKSSKKENRSLAHLMYLLIDTGYVYEVSLDKWLAMQPSYPQMNKEVIAQFNINEAIDKDFELRSDIECLDTNFPSLELSWCLRDDNIQNVFEAQGATLGFFTICKDGFDGKDYAAREVNVQKYVEQFVQYLSEHDDLGIKVLGIANGRYLVYVDVLLPKSVEAFELVDKYLKTSPTQWASFHTFRVSDDIFLLSNNLDEDTDEDIDELLDEEEEIEIQDPFNAVALLKTFNFNVKGLRSALLDEFNAPILEDNSESSMSTVAMVVDGFMLIVEHVNETIDIPRNLNYFWKDVNKVVKKHQSTLKVCVASLGNQNKVEQAKLFARLGRLICKVPQVLGYYCNNVVYHPVMYVGCANHSLPYDNFPTECVVWPHIEPQSNGTTRGFTQGLDKFGKLEFEIEQWHEKSSKLIPVLVFLARYVIYMDKTFKDGEILQLNEEASVRLTVSDGLFIEGQTIKIDYLAVSDKSKLS